MVSTGLWHSLAEWDLTRLQTASAGVRMGPGEGLIGRVIDSGEPVFVADIRRFPDWRRGAAEEFGVKTVIGVPVLINDEVLAVLEFLHSESVSHGSAVIKALGTIGRQIGLAVERHRLARLASERSEQERQIVGQELHDGLGQQIAALGMIATNLSRSLSEQGAPQSATAAKLVRGLDEAKTQVRALTKGLLPLEVETGGLTDALRDLVESARSAFHDIEFVLECDPRAIPEDRFAGNQLYRIAQEALHNATKHASPSRVSIRVSPADGRTRLEIRDDGKGLPDPLPPGGGSGLRIMRHRAGLIGGTLVIDSAPSGGTTVRCVAPAPDPRGRARSDAGS
jgi:signal transduction histidine kinase